MAPSLPDSPPAPTRAGSPHSTQQPGVRSLLRRLPAVGAAYLLAVGIPLAFKLAFHSSVSPALFLVPTLVTATAGILHRLFGGKRWWIILLAALAPIGFSVLLLVGILITPYSSYAVWMESVAAGAPSGSVSNIFVLAYAWFSSVLAPLVLTMGYLWPLLVMAAATMGITAIVYQASIFYALTLVVIAVTVIGLTLRRSHRRHRFAAVLFVLSFLAIALGVARLFTGNGMPHGSRLVDRDLYPKLRELVTDVFPGVPLLYEIPGYGFSFNQKRLGGPTALSSKPLFTIQGHRGETVYLRTVVYDYYDGNSWSIGPDVLSIPKEEKSYYAFDLFKNGTVDLKEKDLRITVELEYYSRLPQTWDTRSIWFEGRMPIISEGTMGTGFVLKKPFRRGDSFVLRRGEPDDQSREPPWLARSALSSHQRAAYLQLPEELPEDVRILANAINPDTSEKPLVLNNICSFLAANASYNLRPEEDLSAGTGDFVAGFLLSKQMQGYCVHFATALVILARLAGIPARYATGYLVYFPKDSDVTEVRGYSSHAWAEVWLEGKGWVTWEATAAVDRAFYEQVGDRLRARFPIDLNRTTQAQIRNLLGEQVIAAPERKKGGPLRLPRWLMVALVSLGGAVLLGAFALVAAPSVRYLFSSPPRRFRLLLARLVRTAARQAVPPPSRVGWIEWGRRVAVRDPERAELVRGHTASIIRALYSDRPFDRSVLKQTRDFEKLCRRVILSGGPRRSGRGRRARMHSTRGGESGRAA